MAGWLAGWVAGLLGGWVAGWLGGWVAGWLAGRLAGWLAGVGGWGAGAWVAPPPTHHHTLKCAARKHVLLKCSFEMFFRGPKNISDYFQMFPKFPKNISKRTFHGTPKTKVDKRPFKVDKWPFKVDKWVLRSTNGFGRFEMFFGNIRK